MMDKLRIIPTLCTVLLGGVLSATEVTHEEQLQHAKRLDAIIQARLEAEQLPPPAIVSDHLFLRRAFLTAIGRIPTPDEARQYQELGSQEARRQLIQDLYQHEGYNSHITNWAMDLLRLKDKNNKKSNAEVLIHWVRDGLANDMPWDELAHELVTAKGSAWLDNPAAGYYAMDPGMQNDNLANTAFSFLGIKLECAQCHDDPFQEWERMDFYELSAFVNGETLLSYRPKGNLRRISDESPEKYNVEGFGRLNQLADTLRYYANFGTPETKGSEHVRIPKDWQYDDATPGEVILARTPFGERVKSSLKTPQMPAPPSFDHIKALPNEEKRSAIDKVKSDYQAKKKQYRQDKERLRKGTGEGLELFGDWLISDETPQFAQTVATRLWHRVMGFSLTEDIGFYVPAEETAFPELVAYLSTLIKDYDYNIRAFQQTLALTMTYQSAATTVEAPNGSPLALSGRRIQRMSAEQLWDSLLALIVTMPEELPTRQLPTHIYHRGYELGTIEEILTHIQALSPEQYLPYLQETYTQMVSGKFPKADRKGRGKGMSSSRMEMGGAMENEGRRGMRKEQKGLSKHLRRASEITSPVSPDHFLATFGQSDRIAIDGSTQEGSVSQALLIYNGAVQRYIVQNRAATLRANLRSIEDPSERIRTIFFSTLTRYPSENELAACLQEVAETGDQAYLNILSALISSQEFLFIT